MYLKKVVAYKLYYINNNTPLLNNSMDQESKITALINAISVKNYAEANKYLKSVIEDKIKSRINTSTNKPLF